MLIDDCRVLLQDAAALYEGTPLADRVGQLVARLDEPLRVAVVGRVKAGKSTLVNALIGDRIAPTDQGECTRIVTWYEDGDGYRFRASLRDGGEAEFHARREGGSLVLDLAGYPAGSIRQLTVTWPSQELRTMTLIDTPGLGSPARELGFRTRSYLMDAGDDHPADAVVYLIRNLHEEDVDFLEAFRHSPVSITTPINALAVLSRADEVGGGAPDAMGTARRRATSLEKSPILQTLVQSVIPVAGLLAETSTTFRESEFEDLRVIATLSPAEAGELLVSAERFIRLRPDLAVSADDRHDLLRRMGLYGVRLSVMLLRRNAYRSAGELADDLRSRCGIEQLRSMLDTAFHARRDELKTYAVLTALVRLLTDHPRAGADGLIDEITALFSSPSFEQLDLLLRLRRGALAIPVDLRDEMDRIIGGAGPSKAQRLGLDPDASAESLAGAALDALARWQRVRAHPLTCGDLRHAADVVTRACELLVVA